MKLNYNQDLFLFYKLMILIDFYKYVNEIKHPNESGIDEIESDKTSL